MDKSKYNLEERLIDFAVAIIKFAEKLPNTYAGKHLGGQIIRSGTSPALNYGEAQAAESKADFAHKMKVCLKELRETHINLRIISKSNMVNDEDSQAIMKECSELVAIFTRSIETINSKITK
jgi:four helix bundle protein